MHIKQCVKCTQKSLFIMYRVMYIEYDVSLLVVYVVCIIEAAV